MKNNTFHDTLVSRYQNKPLPASRTDMVADLNVYGLNNTAQYVLDLDDISYDDLIWDLESVQIEFECNKQRTEKAST